MSMSQVEFKVDGEWMMEEDNMEEVDSLYTLYFMRSKHPDTSYFILEISYL